MTFLPSPRLATPLLVLLCLLVPSSAGARTPVSFFGVIGDGPLLTGQEDVAAQTAVMHAVGVGSMRLAVYWDSVEPYATPDAVPASDQGRFVVRDGVPTDLAAYDNVILAAARSRITILPVVQRAPTWAAQDPLAASGSPPRKTADYTAFLRILVERYGPHGSLWAEHPDVRPRPDPRLADLERAGHHEVLGATAVGAGLRPPAAGRAPRRSRRADPHSKTVAAGLTNRSWDDLRSLYAPARARRFDVAAIHPYSRRVANVVRLVRLARTEMRSQRATRASRSCSPR